MPGVDVHTHLAPVLTAELASQVHGGPPLLQQPESLVAYLDEVGLDRALVSPPPPFYRQDVDVAASAVWVAALNAGVEERCADHSRLKPVAYLPLEHPELAADVYAALRGPGIVVTGAAGGRSQRLDGESFTPLWRMLAEDGASLLLHPGTSQDARLAPHYQENLTGNPLETTVAASQLVFGQVVTRFAGLRIVLVHCAGAVPMLAGRWRRGISTSRPGLPEPAVDLDAELRGIWFDSLSHDAEAMRLAVSVFGEDRIVMGSDWPFPMGSSNPCADVRALNLFDQAVANGDLVAGVW
ncbi:MAG: amidohydrolase family protein [Actinomycetes bacterium]|jgi:aminocarboxymuconate-semialdehyde decarboxylase